MHRFLPLLLLASACASTQTPWWQRSAYSSGEEAAVSGSVMALDIVPEPIAGVRVEAVLEGRVVAETLTDEAGRYRLSFEAALGELCIRSGRQQGKKTPHWPLTLRFFKDGFEPTQAGTMVPGVARPLDTGLSRKK